MSSQKFAIERSPDGVDWEVIAFVEREGTGSYTWTDGGLEPGTLYYYRVRSWDNDALYSAYSNTDSDTTDGASRPLSIGNYRGLSVTAVPYSWGGNPFHAGDITRASDWTDRVVQCEFSTNKHGFESLILKADLDIKEAFAWYDLKGFWVEVNHLGKDVWNGRAEIVTMGGDGFLNVTAFGTWRVFYDHKWTGFLGSTSYERWRNVTNDMCDGGLGSGFFPELFASDYNNRIYATLNKNTAITSGNQRWATIFSVPRGSEDWYLEFDSYVNKWAITGATFDYEIRLPYTASPLALWEVKFKWAAYPTTSGDIPGAGGSTHTTVYSDGTLQTGTVTMTRPDVADLYPLVWIEIYNNGWTGTVTNETGYWYVKILMDEIAGGYQETVGNPWDGKAGQLVSNFASQTYSRGLIQETFLSKSFGTPYDGAEITDLQFEDAYLGDVMIELASMPDANGDLYEVGIWDGQVLQFAPVGTSSQRWVIDVQNYELTFDSDSIINQVTVSFKDRTYGKRRTSLVESEMSQRVTGQHRHEVFELDTTSLSTAEDAAAWFLAANEDGFVKADFDIDKIYTEGGVLAAPWAVRANDTIVVGNLPPIFEEAAYEFRIGRTSYNAMTNKLQLELVDPKPTVVNLLAEGVSV